ncbi:MAG: type II toxin-antitoxin system VapC family toxin [Candidatus Helarchaeota archaeon]
MRLLLDTNVFNSKEMLLELKKRDNSRIQVFINSIVYLELGFIYYVRKKWELFTRILKELKIKNENITKIIAERAIKAATIFKNTEKGAAYYFRDCLIGATADIRKMTLITQNVKDFAWLQKSACMTPDELLVKLKE